LLLTLLVSSLLFSRFWPTLVYAQDLGGLGTTWTWLVVAVIAVIAILLIALRFKWIEFSVDTEKPPSARVPEPTDTRSFGPRAETVAETSDRVLGEYKNGLQSAVLVLEQQKEALAAERDRLREARTDVASDARSYVELVAELEKSRDQARESTLGIAKLKERLAARTEEIERLQAQLTMDREELRQVREKLQSERHELDELRNRLEKKRLEVDKAIQEVAREWELLGVRREELERTRNELFDALQSFKSTREGLLAELKASAEVWGGKTT